MRSILSTCAGIVLVAVPLAVPGEASMPLSFEGERTGCVTGTLRGPDGAAIPGARFRVEIVPEGMSQPIALTEDVDVTGQYSLRTPYRGATRVRAFATIPSRSGYHRVELEPVGGPAVFPGDASQGFIKDFRLRGSPRAPLQPLVPPRQIAGSEVPGFQP